MSIFTPKAEMLHFIVEVQTRAAGLEATFLAAGASRSQTLLLLLTVLKADNTQPGTVMTT